MKTFILTVIIFATSFSAVALAENAPVAKHEAKTVVVSSKKHHIKKHHKKKALVVAKNKLK